MKLLVKGGNAKIDKNELPTWGLSLAPHTANHKGKNLCPFAGSCAKVCLADVGRGKFSNVKDARVRKANYFVDDREAFITDLFNELVGVERYLSKKGIKGAVRLNVLSDIDFYKLLTIYAIKNEPWVQGLKEVFPSVLFYDYTKDYKRAKRYAGTDYVLTYSRDEQEHSEQEALNLAKMGVNVSAVFYPTLPNTYLGLPVVDGDRTDLEMTKQSGVILGLLAKGKEAKNDESGFVIKTDKSA